MKRFGSILYIHAAALVLFANDMAHGQTRQVVAWGSNACGELALPVPNAVFATVTAGNFHSLALRPDSTIAAWGFDGCGRTTVPSPNASFVAIAAGGYHSLALKADGTIVAFGCDDDGQLDVPAPNADFIGIAGGDAASLGLKSDGTVVAWGNNDFGQSTVPDLNLPAVSIAAGWYHSMALKSDGTIVAWGYNGDGQCAVPPPNAGFVAIAAGGAHSLGLKADGTIVAWGNNEEGQCAVPPPNAGFIAIAAGGSHSLGLKADGSVVAWGANAEGQCDVPAPNSGFVAIAAGAGHSVAVRSVATLFVDQAATGANTGASWFDAYTDLQSALRSAEPGTGIWVAAGTYRPSPDGDRVVSFHLRSGVGVYGGFSGIENAVEQRNWLTNGTVLNGDIGVPADSTDNSYHVVAATECDSTAILDGFTVTGGNADAVSPDDAGGGLLNQSASPTIGHVAFLENSARRGGAVCNGGGSGPLLVDVIFSQNQADSGGAVTNRDVSSPRIVNAMFWRNTGVHGGAIYHDSAANAAFTNVTFSNNRAVAGGGAIHNETSLRLTNAILRGDSSATGEEIWNGPSGACVIANSLVEGSGGSGAGWNAALGTDGGGNLDGDPMFVDAVAGNLRIADGSPAINAGTNSAQYLAATDLDGNPRIIGGRVDMGAYENLTGAVAPVAVDDTVSVLLAHSVIVDDLANDFDTDGTIDSSSVTIVTPPLHGSAAVDTVTGAITYLHDGSPNDTDSLSYTVLDNQGSVSNVAWVRITVDGILSGVGDPPHVGPTRFVLYQNSPNPFNPSTAIEFDVPAGGGHVRLDIYDVAGRLVARLLDRPHSGGHKLVRWDGTDRRGQRVSSGVYFYRLTAPGFQQTRKMTLVQ